MTNAQTGKPVLIRSVSKRYADVVALNDVSIEVAAGEFCTLLGASGSGKTTLLKVIAGFEAHDAGKVEVNGHEISATPVADRNIGMVFQNYALFPHMSVFRNVAFGLEMRKLSRAEISRRVSEALDLVSLGEFAERFPAELSGGQQQRVALARALVINPDILLMDEPLGALDKNLRQSIQRQLKALHREVGATIIYVTHDQDEALHLSDRIVILDKGQVVQSGPPEALYFNPVNKFVAGFLGECNFLQLANGEQIGLRPESLNVAGGSDSAKHRITVTVVIESSVFMGSGVKLIGRYENQPIIAFLDNESLSGQAAVGDRLELGFSDSAVLRF